MKKLLLLLSLALLMIAACDKGDGNGGSETVSEENITDESAESDVTVTITLSFSPNTDGILYTAWVEDAEGNLMEPLYACNSLMKTRGGDFNGTGYLTGDPLPYFKTKNGWTPEDSGWEYSEKTYSVDGVTGASEISSSRVNNPRTVDLGSVTEFRVCFDVDTSVNSNDYFQDRPAFTYKTDLINSVDPSGTYTLALDGWMGNDTKGDPWGQDPRQPIDDYEPYKYMQGDKYLPYIIDNDGNYDNLVSSLSVTVE